MKTKLLIAAVCGFSLLLSGSIFGETTEPKKVAGDMPEYSDFARSHDLQGTVVVEALVDENGRVFAAEVVKSVHSELDKATLKAIAQWNFEPAKEDGKPIMRVVRIPIQFNLTDPFDNSVLQAHDSAIAANH